MNPRAPLDAIDDPALDRLITTAAELLHAGVAATGPQTRWVYRRARRPCRRCGTPIVAKRRGEQARTAYWCPRCQAEPNDKLSP